MGVPMSAATLSASVLDPKSRSIHVREWAVIFPLVSSCNIDLVFLLCHNHDALRRKLSRNLFPSFHFNRAYLLPCPSPVEWITEPPIALAVPVYLTECDPSRQRGTRHLEA